MCKIIKYKFRKNNKIQYGQDLSWDNRGIPNIKFDITDFSNSLVKLTADNYGGEPYGNGSIFVMIKDLPKGLKEKVKKEFNVKKKYKCKNCNGIGYTWK